MIFWNMIYFDICMFYLIVINIVCCFLFLLYRWYKEKKKEIILFFWNLSKLNVDKIDLFFIFEYIVYISDKWEFD